MIYVFKTKKSSNKFLEKFVRLKDYVYFENYEVGGEKYFNYKWKNFNYDMPKDVEFCFQGIIRGTHLLKPFMKTNRWYYFDQPYFYSTDYTAHKDFNTIWYRISVNDVQQNKIDNNPKHKERYNNLLKISPKEIELLDWRKSGDHILVIPPSYHTAKWYGISEIEWVKDTVRELKRYTDREIRVRYKFKNGQKFGDKNDVPLDEDLKNCWSIVSWHSMCASHAIRQGIPSFSSEHSPAAPVSYKLNQLKYIEKPMMPDRDQWIYSLLGSQFTLSEMNTGFAYKYINEV